MTTTHPLAKPIVAQDRRALARAITLIESGRDDHRADAEALLDNDLLNIIHSSHGTPLGELLGDVARARNNVNSEFTAEQVAEAHNKVSDKTSAAFTMGSRLVMLCKTNPPILAKRDYQGKTLYKFVDPTVGLYLRLMEARKLRKG